MWQSKHLLELLKVSFLVLAVQESAWYKELGGGVGDLRRGEEGEASTLL